MNVCYILYYFLIPNFIGSTQKLRKDIETIKLKHKIGEKAKVMKIHKVVDLAAKPSLSEIKNKEATLQNAKKSPARIQAKLICKKSEC